MKKLKTTLIEIYNFTLKQYIDPSLWVIVIIFFVGLSMRENNIFWLIFKTFLLTQSIIIIVYFHLKLIEDIRKK